MKDYTQPDAYSVDVYSWIDTVLKAGGFKTSGQTPSVQTMGVNIEEAIYSSFTRRIEKVLARIRPNTLQHEVINEIQNEVLLWSQEMSAELEAATRSLFLRGYAAGIVSSAVKEVMGLVDLQALQLVQSSPNVIGSRIITFSKDLVDKMRSIIASSYTAEGVPFSVPAITNTIRNEIQAKRWMIERIVRTETSVVSNTGRLVGWNADPYKYYYEYHWNAHFDDRTKTISKIRSRYNPLSFSEACFLWERQEQLLPNGKWQADQFNQRCTLSRKPIDTELRGNRFQAKSMDFVVTTTIGFSYE